MSRVFPPLPADHPATRLRCASCTEPFVEGDQTTIYMPEPDGAEEQIKAAEGRAHRTVGGLAHARCAGVTGHEAETRPQAGYPTIERIEAAGLVELIGWLRGLPSPDDGSRPLMNRILERAGELRETEGDAAWVSASKQVGHG